ncbi:MAG: NUDIX domain-containing protein [Candidatus Aenigmarchaeota archaeon]|nr:NUDIX domain-containing protein [Candidatus Aenigmarchaeota archaeon]
MKEYFDVVDENDNIIGKELRSVCHNNPKIIHRGIFVIIENELGQLLLEKRSMKKDTNPGKLAVIGEHNLLGESYEKAAIRGLKEELGIKAKVKKIDKLKISSKRETEYDEIFISRINSKQIIKFDKNEISEVMWVSIKKLKKEIKQHPKRFSSWSLKVLKEYFKLCSK